jgi:hypothetical protein
LAARIQEAKQDNLGEHQVWSIGSFKRVLVSYALFNGSRVWIFANYSCRRFSSVVDSSADHFVGLWASRVLLCSKRVTVGKGRRQPGIFTAID